MINVEGNYEEIIDWMDKHPVKGVMYQTNRGVSDDSSLQLVRLNWGLFSILTDHPSSTEGLTCCQPFATEIVGGWRYTVDRNVIYVGTDRIQLDKPTEEDRKIRF